MRLGTLATMSFYLTLITWRVHHFMCCSAWDNFTSCVNATGCTFEYIYQYRLSLGHWYSSYQRYYNTSISTYQFICSRAEGTQLRRNLCL